MRVNHAEMAVALGPGIHRVVLTYRTPGLALGGILAALTALVLGLSVARGARGKRS